MSLKEKLQKLQVWVTQKTNDASVFIVKDMMEFLDDNKPAQDFLANYSRKLEMKTEPAAEVGRPAEAENYITFKHVRAYYRVAVQDDNTIELWMPEAKSKSILKEFRWFSAPLSSMSDGLQAAAKSARMEANSKNKIIIPNAIVPTKPVEDVPSPPPGGIGLVDNFVTFLFNGKYYRTSIEDSAQWLDTYDGNGGWICGTLRVKIEENPDLAEGVRRARFQAKREASVKKSKPQESVVKYPKIVYDDDGEDDGGYHLFDEDDAAAMDALEATIGKDRQAQSAMDVEAPKIDMTAIQEKIKANLAANAADKAERDANEDKFTEKEKIDFNVGTEWLIFQFDGKYYRINKNQSFPIVGNNTHYLDKYTPEVDNHRSPWQMGTYGGNEQNKKLIEAAEECRRTGGLKIPRPKIVTPATTVTKTIPPYRPGAYQAPSYASDDEKYVEFEHEGQTWRIHKVQCWVEQRVAALSGPGYRWTFFTYITAPDAVVKAGEAELAKIGIIRSDEPTDTDKDYILFKYLNRQFRVTYKYSSSFYEWNKKDRSWGWFGNSKDKDVSSGMIDAANEALIAAEKPPIEGTYKAKAREEVTGDVLDCFDIGESDEADELIGSLKDKVVKKKETKTVTPNYQSHQTQVFVQGQGWIPKDQASKHKAWYGDEWDYRHDY
jgi:hypothetical protein